jgi:hypothetical protein
MVVFNATCKPEQPIRHCFGAQYQRTAFQRNRALLAFRIVGRHSESAPQRFSGHQRHGGETVEPTAAEVLCHRFDALRRVRSHKEERPVNPRSGSLTTVRLKRRVHGRRLPDAMMRRIDVDQIDWHIDRGDYGEHFPDQCGGTCRPPSCRQFFQKSPKFSKLRRSPRSRNFAANAKCGVSVCATMAARRPQKRFAGRSVIEAIAERGSFPGCRRMADRMRLHDIRDDHTSSCE